MTLKEIKTLQEMGFSLDEIKAEYFKETVGDDASELKENKPVQEHPEPEKPTEGKGPEVEEASKKNDSLDSLKNEVSEIKKLIFEHNSRENLSNNKANTDPVLSAFNNIINGGN